MARSAHSTGTFKKLGVAGLLGLALVLAAPASAQADSRVLRTYPDYWSCIYGGSVYVATGGATTYLCRPFYSAGQGGYALVVYY